RADDVFVETRRQALALDVSHEAGLVAAAKRSCDRLIAGSGLRSAPVQFLFGMDGLGGHGAGCLRSHACATRSGIGVRRRGGGAGLHMSASVTLSSAAAIAWLMRCQFARTSQRGSRPHAPACKLHSVMPIGPSIAVTMSATVMRSGARASR